VPTLQNKGLKLKNNPLKPLSDNGILDIIIDLGIVLTCVGQKDPKQVDKVFWKDEKYKLGGLSVGDHYWVYSMVNTYDIYPLFDVAVTNDGIELITFNRGQWEQILNSLAQDLRRKHAEKEKGNYSDSRHRSRKD